jgi:hypothetical protein
MRAEAPLRFPSVEACGAPRHPRFRTPQGASRNFHPSYSPIRVSAFSRGPWCGAKTVFAAEGGKL